MDQKYKKSVFNYVVEDPNETILYNSYTEKIVCSKKCKEIEDLLKGQECNDIKLKENMIADGFLVSNDEDEQAKGKLKYYERIFDRLLSLTFLTTEQCNFRCKYCYEDFEKGKMKDEVVNGVIRYLKKNLSSYSGVSIDWFGGEPLLALDVIEKFSVQAIELCKQVKKPYIAGMTTNGYLLTPEVFERLLKLKVYNYQITIDGVQENHDKYRTLKNGAPTFEKIIDNLQNISKNIKSNAFKIAIRANITKESFEHIDEFMDLMYKEFHHDKRFTVFFRPVGDWGGERVKLIKSNLLEKENALISKLLTYNNSGDFAFDTYETLLNAGVCYAAIRNNYIIGSDGIIYKCTLHFKKSFNQVGKVLENGKFDIDINKLAKWVTPDSFPAKCTECYMSNACPGGQCAAQRMLIDNKSDLNCGYEVNDIENLLRVICLRGNRTPAGY